MSRLRIVLPKLHVPAGLWLALIGVAITWLPQLMPDAPWASQALIIILAILRAIEVIIRQQNTSMQTPDEQARSAAESFKRWWLG